MIPVAATQNERAPNSATAKCPCRIIGSSTKLDAILAISQAEGPPTAEERQALRQSDDGSVEPPPLVNNDAEQQRSGNAAHPSLSQPLCPAARHDQRGSEADRRRPCQPAVPEDRR